MKAAPKTLNAQTHLGVLRKSSPPLPVSCRPYRDFNFDQWQPGTSLSSHRHGFLQFIHLLEGTLTIDWGEGWNPIQKGMLHILPSGFSHKLQSTEGHSQFGLNFTSESDEGGILSLLETRLTRPAALAVKVPVSLQMLRVEIGQGALEILRFKHLLDEYVLNVLEALSPSSPAATSKAVLRLVSQYATAQLSVEKAAHELRLSRATLQRLCREHFSCGFAQLHERVRLGKASQILLNTDLNIGQIAEACGYADLFSFSRAFKRTHGIAPHFYRKKGSPKSDQWRAMIQ